MPGSEISSFHDMSKFCPSENRSRAEFAQGSASTPAMGVFKGAVRSLRRLFDVETLTLLSRLLFPKWFPYNPARYTAGDTGQMRKETFDGSKAVGLYAH